MYIFHVRKDNVIILIKTIHALYKEKSEISKSTTQ